MIRLQVNNPFIFFLRGGNVIEKINARSNFILKKGDIMDIRIVNLQNYVPVEGEMLIKVDRTSPVGNPFRMHDESQRDRVCEWYEEHFQRSMKNNALFQHYINYIVEKNQITNIALGCWCAPKRCHAETILKYVTKNVLKISI